MTTPTKKPTPAALERLAKKIAAADAERRATHKQIAALTKLQARYARQLKALTAGLRLLVARERAAEKEVAALKKEREKLKAARKAKRAG